MTTRKLVALGIAGISLLAAAPANAEQNQTPTDQNGKKSCEYAKWGGGTGYYPHGTSITVTLPDGGSKTVKCNDGNWETKARRFPSTLQFRATSVAITASGKLVMKNARMVKAQAVAATPTAA